MTGWRGTLRMQYLQKVKHLFVCPLSFLALEEGRVCACVCVFIGVDKGPTFQLGISQFWTTPSKPKLFM